MTTNGQIHLELGELKGRMEGIERSIKNLNQHMDNQSSVNKEILKFINQTRGAKKMLLGLVGAGAIIGAVSTKLTDIFLK